MKYPLLIFVLSLNACAHPDEKLKFVPGEKQAEHKGYRVPLDKDRKWDPEEGAFGTKEITMPK